MGLATSAERLRSQRARGLRRSGEALPLLLTLSSGVQGFTTIHAGSARQSLSRLRFICQLAETGSELSVAALSALVSEAVDVVVHCARQGREVRVTEVLAVEDLQVGPATVAFTTTPIFIRPRFLGPMGWTGNLPVRSARALELAGIDIRSLVGADRAVPPAPARADADGGTGWDVVPLAGRSRAVDGQTR